MLKKHYETPALRLRAAELEWCVLSYVNGNVSGSDLSSPVNVTGDFDDLFE